MKNLSNLEFGKVFLNMTQKAQTGREKHISKFESIKTSVCLHFTSVCVLVTQLWLTLRDPMDYRLPGSSIHGILQARILEWVAMPFSRGNSWLRDQIRVSWTAGRFFTVWADLGSPFTSLPHGKSTLCLCIWNTGIPNE